MNREERIRMIAEEIKTLIMANPGMCCFGKNIDEDGNTLDMVVGFDGYIDLRQLAEWLYVRMG